MEPDPQAKGQSWSWVDVSQWVDGIPIKKKVEIDK